MILDNLLLAKILGATLVILLLFALRFWFAVARNRNNIVPRVVLNKNDLFDLHKDFNSFKEIPAADQDVILNRIGILLSKVKFIDENYQLLERREAIQMSYVYVCENWTEDFNVNADWIFSFSDAITNNENSFRFSLSTQDYKNKRGIVKPPKR